MISLTSAICGGLITLCGLFGLILNIKVMYTLYRYGFLKTYSNIYILAFCGIFANSIQLFISFTYLGPTSIMQQDYFEKGLDSLGTKFYAWLFLISWYSDMLLQPIIAFNRFIMIIFPSHAYIFTRKKTIVYGTTIIIFSICASFCAQFFLPCCTVYVYYRIYSYMYIGTGFNYIEEYIDYQFNGSIFSTTILLYIIIFFYVRRNNSRITGLTEDQRSSRKIKEIKYAIQFGWCSIFAFLGWVMFRLFPMVVPADQLHWFSAMGVSVSLHSTTTSLIFIVLNREVKEKFFGRPSQYTNNSANHPSKVTGTGKVVPSDQVVPNEGASPQQNP